MQQQTVIEFGEHIGNLLTIPNVPCYALAGCTDILKNQVGEKWKQGKVTAGLQGDQKSFYSWKPGYWTSICIDISQSERKIYVNGQLGKFLFLHKQEERISLPIIQSLSLLHQRWKLTKQFLLLYSVHFLEKIKCMEL